MLSLNAWASCRIASRFVVTLERPLFSPSRRPVPKAPPQPVDTLADVAIVGIWGDGAQGGVIARIGQQQKRVRVGEPLADWTLKEVQTQGATLTRGKETRSLPIRRAAVSTRPAFERSTKPTPGTRSHPASTT